MKIRSPVNEALPSSSSSSFLGSTAQLRPWPPPHKIRQHFLEEALPNA
jgi:hypothetical protein